MKNRCQAQSTILYSHTINTPLGHMIAITSNQALFFLKFTDTHHLNQKVQSFLKKHNAIIQPGRTTIIKTLKSELKLYFESKLTNFSIPLHYTGTPFQKSTWQVLLSIKPGNTTSYSELSFQITGNYISSRAIARANAANLIAIIIPCHRVIHKKGTLSGYNGGINRKQWLLNHETKI